MKPTDKGLDVAEVEVEVDELNDEDEDEDAEPDDRKTLDELIAEFIQSPDKLGPLAEYMLNAGDFRTWLLDDIHLRSVVWPEGWPKHNDYSVVAGGRFWALLYKRGVLLAEPYFGTPVYELLDAFGGPLRFEVQITRDEPTRATFFEAAYRARMGIVLGCLGILANTDGSPVEELSHVRLDKMLFGLSPDEACSAVKILAKARDEIYSPAALEYFQAKDFAYHMGGMDPLIHFVESSLAWERSEKVLERAADWSRSSGPPLS